MGKEPKLFVVKIDDIPLHIPERVSFIVSAKTKVSVESIPLKGIIALHHFVDDDGQRSYLILGDSLDTEE